MKIDVVIIARFILWLQRVYKVMQGNSVSWFRDHVSHDVADEILKEIINQQKKP